MASFGGLGGLGGVNFGDLLSAFGQSLLSSPRHAPFAALPQTMQSVTERAKQRGSEGAMMAAPKVRRLQRRRRHGFCC